MDKEPKNRIPKGARYPLFFLGLLVIIVGELTAQSMSGSLSSEVLIGVVGFVLLILSVALQ